MVAMEEFRLQVMSPFYHRPAFSGPCPDIFPRKVTSASVGAIIPLVGTRSYRELGHDSPWMRRPLKDVVPGAFSFLRYKVVRYPRRPDTGISMGTAVFCALFPLAYPGDRSGRPATSGGLIPFRNLKVLSTPVIPAILAHHQFARKE